MCVDERAAKQRGAGDKGRTVQTIGRIDRTGFAARPRTYAPQPGLRSNPTVWAFSVATVMLRGCDTLSGGLSCGCLAADATCSASLLEGIRLQLCRMCSRVPDKKIENAVKGAICSV